MFEEIDKTNNYEITRNEKQNGGNRVNSYFKSYSFLAQQEELAMFVKNMPIIRLEEVSSINKLIELLILQNEVLGKRCQQNVITVKEMFAKHEELMRVNRELQGQIQESKKMIQYNTVNQSQIDSYEQQLARIKGELEAKGDTMAKLTEMTEQLMESNKHCLQSLQGIGEVIGLINEKNFKKCGQKVKELTKQNKERWEWVDFEGLERFIKQEKKRAKYIPKVRETVELFCNRFLKISEYVSISILKDQFNKEVLNLLQILDDLLLLRRKSMTSNSQNSQSRLSVDFSNSDCNFFEGVLNKILKDKESSSSSRQQIVGELMAVRKELQECKSAYQQYLINAKLEYEQLLRKRDEQLTEKSQIQCFYQEEKEKTIKQLKEMENKIQYLEEALKIEKGNGQAKAEQIFSLQAKLEQVKSQGVLRQTELKAQWQQNVKTFQYKLSQKQELLEEEQKLRRALKGQFEEEKSKAKIVLEEVQGKYAKLVLVNKDLNENIQDLKSVIEKMRKKAEEELASHQKQQADKSQTIEELAKKKEKDQQLIKRLKEECQDNEKEKALQAAYIKQLQQKSRDLLNKIKSVQSKKSEEKTAKKQMDVIKRTFLEEKKYSREVEENLQTQKEQTQRLKEDNQRLKGVIKEMKKQLQEVYYQFSQLKAIQSDRQKLVIEMQRSDRAREDLLRSCQLHKGELLRLQQQNKSLALETKHYKSALNRIDALRV